MGVVCLSTQGQVIRREGAVSDKGVSAFNAKVELHNYREWLRRLRGEVDAGLQRLDRLFKDMAVTGPGPGQGQTVKGWVAKPKWRPKPRGKTIFIPKDLGVGLGSGPIVCKASGQARSEDIPPAGLGLMAGSSGLSNGRPGSGFFKDDGQSKRPK